MLPGLPKLAVVAEQDFVVLPRVAVAVERPKGQPVVEPLPDFACPRAAVAEQDFVVLPRVAVAVERPKGQPVVVPLPDFACPRAAVQTEPIGYRQVGLEDSMCWGLLAVLDVACLPVE